MPAVLPVAVSTSATPPTAASHPKSLRQRTPRCCRASPCASPSPASSRWRPRRWRSGRWSTRTSRRWWSRSCSGIAVRTVWAPDARFRSGIAFSAKQLLEVAVVLLGASLSLGAILASGPALLAGIVATVAIGIGASIADLPGARPAGPDGDPGRLRQRDLRQLGHRRGRPGDRRRAQGHRRLDRLHRGARRADGARTCRCSYRFAGLSDNQYGVLAGLTVYAVPQVLAATVPVSLLSTQVGTLVKLVRVLMLGPGGGLIFSLDRAPPAARAGRGTPEGRAASASPS